MPVPIYTTTCLNNTLIARDVYEFRLTRPAGFSFQPGQYVLFDVPLIANASDIQTRAFSIASAPLEDDLLFVAKMVSGGRASRWIGETLKEGTVVNLKGPFGRFLLDRDTRKEYLMIATGTGNAPMRSQLTSVLRAGETRRIDLIFGVFSEEHVFWQDVFAELERAHPNFRFHLTLSNPSDAWTGHRGWVQKIIPEIAPDLATKSIYICGNPNMVADVRKLCATLGAPKADVHFEGYI